MHAYINVFVCVTVFEGCMHIDVCFCLCGCIWGVHACICMFVSLRVYLKLAFIYMYVCVCVGVFEACLH